MKCECGSHIVSCEECSKAVCLECDWEGVGENVTLCGSCHEEADRAEAAEWAWMAPLAKQRVEACRSLDIPADSTDAEVMAAARGLK